MVINILGVLLSDLTLILLAAGSSSRFEMDIKKQWLRVGHEPLWHFVAKRLQNLNFFSKIIIASSIKDIEFMKNYADYTFAMAKSELLFNKISTLNEINKTLNEITTQDLMLTAKQIFDESKRSILIYY